jgi:hypothetical protein
LLDTTRVALDLSQYKPPVIRWRWLLDRWWWLWLRIVWWLECLLKLWRPAAVLDADSAPDAAVLGRVFGQRLAVL